MTLKVTYIGHATTLIQWDGINILTDPVFSDRILFFKRLKPLNFDLSQLPKLDCICLSHAHYDHLDLFSYKYIPSDVPIIIPEGMTGAINRFVGNPIVEMTTWSRYTLKENVKICAIPSRHVGGRLFWPFRYTKCHGYVISKGVENIYFAGDTAYQNEFENLRSLFPIKLAILPVATNAKNAWVRSKHMNVQDVVRCWKDLGKPDWIPIHWGTFFKWLNKPEIILAALEEQARQDPLLFEKMHLMEPGGLFEIRPG